MVSAAMDLLSYPDPPARWALIDYNNSGLRFPPAVETFKTIRIDTALIESVRQNYPLLQDRIGDYSALSPIHVSV